MPMVFDDLLCRLAIEEYMVKTGRKKSIYLPSNIDYFKEILATNDVLGTFLKSDWYVTARAFFCGKFWFF